MPEASPVDTISIETEHGEQRLEYRRYGRSVADTPTAVFLHEGLGHLDSWRHLPQALADRCGCATLTYSRAGYGRSRPHVKAREASYLHDEALTVLPALLTALNITDTCLIGHSDGASIALLNASSAPAGRVRCHGVVAIAPHVMVEPISLRGIEQAVADYEGGMLRMLLARQHEDPDGCFYAWANIWRSSQFRHWSIEADLAAMRCPALLIQGEDDPYGSLAQLEAIQAAVIDSLPLARLVLAGVRHAPHLEAPEIVLQRIGEFVMSAVGDS